MSPLRPVQRISIAQRNLTLVNPFHYVGIPLYVELLSPYHVYPLCHFSLANPFLLCHCARHVRHLPFMIKLNLPHLGQFPRFVSSTIGISDQPVKYVSRLSFAFLWLVLDCVSAGKVDAKLLFQRPRIVVLVFILELAFLCKTK